MRVFSSFSSLLLGTSVLFVDSAADTFTRSCGTKDLSANDMRLLDAQQEIILKNKNIRIRQDVDYHFDKHRNNDVDSSSTGGVIDVYFHVITSSDNTGNLNDATIDQQIDVLNNDYAGGGWSFVLKGVTRTANDGWFNMRPDTSNEQNAKSALRRGSGEALNLYSVDAGDSLLGWATLPSWYNGNKLDDGCVIHYGSVPGGHITRYNDGDTATHEVGHWMGLYHTFQGGCSEPGDGVADTPAVKEANSICDKNLDSCPSMPGLDMVENFMDYTDSSCMNTFTSGQFARMQNAWNSYRAGSDCQQNCEEFIPSIAPTITYMPTEPRREVVYSIDDTFKGGNFKCVDVDAAGDLKTIAIDMRFTMTTSSWGSDLFIAVVDPVDEVGVQVGGYEYYFKSYITNIIEWDSVLNDVVNGDVTTHVDVKPPFPVKRSYKMCFGNGYQFGNEISYSGSIILSNLIRDDSPTCAAQEKKLGDGKCDQNGINNVAECNWDGGDCCKASCESNPNPKVVKNCGKKGYQCLDPQYNGPAPAPNPPTPDGPTPLCKAQEKKLGDGKCDQNGVNNVAECNWDGGDCCKASCESNPNPKVVKKCGKKGYQCLDPLYA